MASRRASADCRGEGQREPVEAAGRRFTATLRRRERSPEHRLSEHARPSSGSGGLTVMVLQRPAQALAAELRPRCFFQKIGRVGRNLFDVRNAHRLNFPASDELIRQFLLRRTRVGRSWASIGLLFIHSEEEASRSRQQAACGEQVSFRKTVARGDRRTLVRLLIRASGGLLSRQACS